MIGCAALLAGLAAALAVRGGPRTRSVQIFLRPIPVLPICAGGALFLMVGGPWGAGAGAVAAVLVGRGTGHRRRVEDQWNGWAPVVLELIAAAARAGVPPESAVRTAAEVMGSPRGDGLVQVAEAWRYGLSALGADLDPPSRVVAEAIERTQESGAAPALALEQAAAELAADYAVHAQERARRVGVQAAVPLGVCLLPAFLCLGVAPLVASLMTGVVPR